MSVSQVRPRKGEALREESLHLAEAAPGYFCDDGSCRAGWALFQSLFYPEILAALRKGYSNRAGSRAPPAPSSASELRSHSAA